ncbi:hypothetical protein [Umezawaea sp.]|uniref:hypothetical protein n=1 Tax=Umezawaea sp. TaxID=1955258 RepID=UPI002ED63FA2
MVASRNALDDATRAKLDAVTAWPVRVVEENGHAVGIVMPLIPEPYFDLVTRNAGVKKSLREVQNLFVAPDRALRLGRPVPTDEQRLRICRDFAGGLAFLHHELKIVVGDVNPKNAVYRLDAEPMVLFLDCDAVRPTGVVARVKQLNFPDWLPPEGGALSRATDHYKLGLFILRCLTPGAYSSVNTDPAAAATCLDPEGLAMLRRALGPVPADRPTAREWEARLRLLLGESLVPPRLGEVRLDRAVVLAGQSVVVEWEARDAVEVEVTAGAVTSRVDGAPGRGRTSVAVAESGWVDVRAVNNLGTDHRRLGPLTAVAPPRIHPLPVPVPQVAWPLLGQAGPPRAELPPLPAVDVRAMAPEAFTTGGRRPPLPSVPAPTAGFPFDLRAMLTESPGFDPWFHEGEGAGR